MKQTLGLLTLLFAFCMSAVADDAFRLHRYDTFKVEPITSNSIVFVGNSITDMHPWTEAFGGNPRIVNRGNSGGKSDEILANVRSYCAGKPAKIFLMIGINDLHAGTSYTTVVSNVQQTIAAIKEISPSTQIYLQSVLPSTYANLTTIQNCNSALQTMLATNGYSDVTYIDVYSLLLDKVNTDTTGRYSFDSLHLTAAGYEIWTKALEPYLDGIKSVYTSNALSQQNNGGLSSSFGARATYFSMLPITANDVLFFGDEMVKNGEWHELLGNQNIKNRGTNWDYDQSKYATITNTRGGITSTFATVDGVSKVAPKQILLYTGTGEVNGTSSVNTIFTSYTQLIDLIRQYAPAASTKISLVSLMPTTTAGNSRVKEFNALIENYVSTYGATQNLEYIDIYSTLATASDGVKKAYFPASNNYIYGDGYTAITSVLAQHIEGCSPVTAEEAAAYRALVNADSNNSTTSTPTGIVGGKQYTIRPYNTSKYVVPAAGWTSRGGNMTSYSTAAPTVENGAVWTFTTADNGFVIHPASSTFTTAYLNPWDASSKTENAIGVWNEPNNNQVWYVTLVSGQENVYTIRNKDFSTAYMYNNSGATELYFNKPGTPTEANYFVIEPFGEEETEPTPTADNVLWTGGINNANIPWMRIPAIVKTQSGDLLAFADYRHNHDDIGRNASNTRIDIQMRRSIDDGATWSNAITVAYGSGELYSTDGGYGDAAVVADNGGSGKVLLLAAAGSVSYGSSTRSNPIRMAKLTSNNNGSTWSSPLDITSTIYNLLPSTVTKAFSSSGRIEQSTFKKAGASYNRIYDPLCTNGGNFVLYSDDFGETWAVLGNGCGQTNGDEAHVVELPNGDLILVSRNPNGGRYINLFTYTKNAQGIADFNQGGSWATSGYTNGTAAAACNGDIDIITGYAPGSNVAQQVLIQSAPRYGSPRRQVSYHYKALPSTDSYGNYTLSNFTSGWTLGLEVSAKASAYSSIVNIGEGVEAMLYEEAENEVSGTSDPYAYNIVFAKNTINEITKGAYVAVPTVPAAVNYVIIHDGKEIGTIQHEESHGEAPTVTNILPSYVSITEGLPAKVTGSSYTLHTTYNNTMPFEVGTKLYQMNLSNGGYWIYANSSFSNAKESAQKSDNPDYIWRVGGDWLNGFTFCNMLGYYIGAPSTSPINSTNTTLTTEETTQTRFDMVQNGELGFRFKPYGGSNYLAHTSYRDLNVQFFDYYERDRSYNNGNRINFVENTTFLANIQSNINAVLAMQGKVGYPADMTSLAPYSDNGVTASNHEEALATLNSLYSSSDIVKPEAGKAYRLSMVKPDGTKVYIGANGTLSTDITNAAILVTGEKTETGNYQFFFVTDDGSNFLNHKGTTSTAYSANINSFSINALAAASNSYINKTAQQRFGYVYMTTRNRTDDATRLGCMIMQISNNTWNKTDAPYFNDSYTSAVAFEEVDNTNVIKLSNPNPQGSSRLDGKYVGTFSAPFAVELPTDIVAYTAEVNDAKNVVTFNTLGNVVPADTGVLLYAADAQSPITAKAIPATSAPEATNNAFIPTNGEEVPEGSFILGNGKNGVGFYLIGNNRVVAKNKAYLPAEALAASSISFQFDFDSLEFIDTIESADKVQQIYDLQGRRVNEAQKGCFIINGKKIIR